MKYFKTAYNTQQSHENLYLKWRFFTLTFEWMNEWWSRNRLYGTTSVHLILDNVPLSSILAHERTTNTQLDEWMSGETGLEYRSNIYGVFGVFYQNDQPKSNSKAEKSHAICTCVTFEFQIWIWQTVLKLSNCIEMFTFDSLFNIVDTIDLIPVKIIDSSKIHNEIVILNSQIKCVFKMLVTVLLKGLLP